MGMYCLAGGRLHSLEALFKYDVLQIIKIKKHYEKNIYPYWDA